jgi:hypothetical protein
MKMTLKPLKTDHATLKMVVSKPVPKAKAHLQLVTRQGVSSERAKQLLS